MNSFAILFLFSCVYERRGSQVKPNLIVVHKM